VGGGSEQSQTGREDRGQRGEALALLEDFLATVGRTDQDLGQELAGLLDTVKQFQEQEVQQIKKSEEGDEKSDGRWQRQGGGGRPGHSHLTEKLGRMDANESLVGAQSRPLSLVVLLDRPACMNVPPLSLPYLSRDVHRTTKGYVQRHEGHGRPYRELGNKTLDNSLGTASTTSTSSYLSSTASSNNRQRTHTFKLSSNVHKNGRNGNMNRLRMSSSSGYGHGTLLGRHRREMTALLLPKRAGSSSGEDGDLDRVRSIESEQLQQSPIRVSPGLRSVLGSEVLEGHMTISLDRNRELALGGSATTGRLYDLSDPFGRGHAFHALQAQGGSDGSHVVNGAQPCQRAKSRQRHGARVEYIKKCTSLMRTVSTSSNQAAAGQGNWVHQSQEFCMEHEHTEFLQPRVDRQQRAGRLPATIHWSRHDPRSRRLAHSQPHPRTSMLGFKARA